MEREELFKIVDYIIDRGWELVQKYIKENNLEIDYVDIFCRDQAEFNELMSAVQSIGGRVESTKTGFTYKLREPYRTKYGLLYLVKIRKPDLQKSQRGAPDFRVRDYIEFKRKYEKLENMKLIVRSEYEMLELSDPDFDVFVYFPDKPLTKDLGIL